MRKFYNGIAEINYVSFANWVSWKVKSISGLLNTNKGKSKNTFAFDRMTQYLLIKACSYIVVPQQKNLENWDL